MHGTTTTSGNASINFNGNGAAAHNCTSSVDVNGINWDSDAAITTSGYASINFNSNSAAAHNCTSSVNAHGIYWSSQLYATTTTSDNASINFNGNSAAAHNCTSSANVRGINWDSDAAITTSGYASINFNSNSAAAQYCTSTGSLSVYALHLSTKATVTGNASITIKSNSATSYYCSVAGSMDVSGLRWSTSTITAGSNAIIAIDGNSAVVVASRVLTAQGTILSVTGSLMRFPSTFSLTGTAQLQIDANTATLLTAPALPGGTISPTEVRGAVFELAVASRSSLPSLLVAAGSQIAARGNSANVNASNWTALTVVAFALSVSCGRAEWNCSAVLLALPPPPSSPALCSPPLLAPLVASGNKALVAVGCGGTASTSSSAPMRVALSAVSLTFTNLNNVTFGRGT